MADRLIPLPAHTQINPDLSDEEILWLVYHRRIPDLNIVDIQPRHIVLMQLKNLHMPLPVNYVTMKAKPLVQHANNYLDRARRFFGNTILCTL